MLNNFRSIFGGLDIKETEKEIIIKGVYGNEIDRDICKHWKTTKLTTHLFNYVGRRELRFNKFFAVEVVYMLEAIKQYRSRHTSVKMLNQIIAMMYEKTWLSKHKEDRTNQSGRLDFNRLKNIVDHFKPETFQMEYFQDYNLRLDKYGLRGDLIAADPGTGKAQSLNAMIKIPNGWVRMGDIKVGDSVVTPKGSITKVNGVYPQGIRPLNLVTLEDGRQTEGCLEHLWKVEVNNEWVILQTKDLMELLEQGEDIYLPLIESTPDKLMIESELQALIQKPLEGIVRLGNQLINNRYVIYLARALGATAEATEHGTVIDFTQTKIRVRSIVPTQPEECQCISVEDPERLYITDDFIVTHNTYMTSAIAEMLGSELIVVVVPKEVLDTVWLEEIEAMFKTKQTVLHSFNRNEPYTGQRWIVCHYNAMPWLIDLLKDPKVVGNKKTCLILDESHNFNDPNSLRTKLFRELVTLVKSDNNILSSGTAVKAIGAELINMLWVIDPLFDKNTEERFKKMFGKEATKGQDIIRHRMGIISHKIEKSVLGQEPPVMRDYPIKIPNGDMFTLPEIKKVMEKFINDRWAYYKSRRKEDERFWDEIIKIHKNALNGRDQIRAFDEYMSYVKMISKSMDYRALSEEIKATNIYEKDVIEPTLPRTHIKRFRDVKSVIKYTALKIQGECLGRILGGKRTEAHVALVPFVDWVGICESTEKKTLTFTSFVPVVEASEKHCLSLGLKPITVYGKTKNELAATVDRFAKDASLNPLNATYASLSTGVRLTMADTVILLNSPFRSYILEQAVSRVHRKGQDSQVVVYKVTLDTGDVPNISTRSADILAWSTEQVSLIMGSSAPFTLGDSFESYSLEQYDKDNFDENQIMFDYLDSMFSPYGVSISREDFVPKPNVSLMPKYLS